MGKSKHHIFFFVLRPPGNIIDAEYHVIYQAMRVLYNHRRGAGEIYELENMKAFFTRLPAYVVVAALYGNPFPP